MNKMNFRKVVTNAVPRNAMPGGKPQPSDMTYNDIKLNSDNEYVLFLYDGFNDDSCRDLVLKLRTFSDAIIDILDSNEKLKKLGEKEIPLPTLRIVISSCGGAIYDLLALTNEIIALKDLGVTVITEANGYVMSCGFCLFMLGDIRTVTSDFCTEFLYHTVQLHGVVSGCGNTISKDIQRWNKVIFAKYKEIIINETLVTKDMLDQYEEKDWVMGIEEARELRIVNDQYLYDKAMGILQGELEKEVDEENEPQEVDVCEEVDDEAKTNEEVELEDVDVEEITDLIKGIMKKKK